MLPCTRADWLAEPGVCSHHVAAHTQTHTHAQTDRQTDTHTQTDRQTDIHTQRLTDRQTRAGRRGARAADFLCVAVARRTGHCVHTEIGIGGAEHWSARASPPSASSRPSAPVAHPSADRVARRRQGRRRLLLQPSLGVAASPGSSLLSQSSSGYVPEQPPAASAPVRRGGPPVPSGPSEARAIAPAAEPGRRCRRCLFCSVLSVMLS